MAENTSGGVSGAEFLNPVRQDFAVQVAQQQAVQSTQSGQQATPQIVGGRTGGGVVRAPLDPVPEWGKFGDVVQAIVGPQVQRLQKQQFWQGVTAARAGQSVKDIVENESPLTKIFGPSSYAQGAQFYTAQNNLAQYNQDMIANADELARLPPSELGKRLNEQASKYETGDPGTDALVHQSWVEQTGPALSVITKTRFAQQQLAATQAFVDNANTNAKTLQTMVPAILNGTASPDDYKGQQQTVATALTIPPGMTPETYRDLLPKLTKDWADKGNFHAVSLMKQSGALSHMDIKARTSLDDYIERKEKAMAEAYRYSVSPQLAMDLGALHRGALTPAEWTERTKKITEQFKKVTGVVDTPLIPFTEQEDAMLKGVENWWQGQAKIAAANQAAMSKAQTDAEKDAVKARQVEQTSVLIASGAAGDAVSLYNIPKHEVDTLMSSRYDQASPESKDQLLISNWQGSTKYVNDRVKSQLTQGLRATVGGDYSPAVDQVFQNYKRLSSTPEGAATAAAYYESRDRIRLERYGMLLNQGQQPPVAFKVAFQDPLTEAVDYTKTHGDDKEIKDVVKDRADAWLGNSEMGKKPLDDFSQRLLAGLINKNVKTGLANTGLNTSQAARLELNNLQANGLEVYGGTAWVRTPQQKNLESYIRSPDNKGGFNYEAVSPRTLDEVVGKHVEEGMRSVGAKNVESQQVIRLQDVNGVAQFAVIGYTKDGGYAPPYSFTSDDLSRTYINTLKGKVKKGAWWSAGPDVTFLTKDRSDAAAKAYAQGWK